MHKLESVRLPQGLAHDEVEAVVPGLKSISMENKAPKRDRAGSTLALKADKFDIETSMDQLRCPACNRQHEYTGNNGLIKLSIRLNDGKTGYRKKTEGEKRSWGCNICMN